MSLFRRIAAPLVAGALILSPVALGAPASAAPAAATTGTKITDRANHFSIVIPPGYTKIPVTGVTRLAVANTSTGRAITVTVTTASGATGRKVQGTSSTLRARLSKSGYTKIKIVKVSIAGEPALRVTAIEPKSGMPAYMILTGHRGRIFALTLVGRTLSNSDIKTAVTSFRFV